jgi:hypothetical protein
MPGSNHQPDEVRSMAKMVYTRPDIERLIDNLEARSQSIMLSDMLPLQSQMRSAARLLKWMLEKGMPVSTAEIETNG